MLLIFFFLFIAVSGFYLWLPRKWTSGILRSILWFRRGLSSKARDYNWHHLFGFWCTIPLILVIAGAVVISYPWASNLVFRAAGSQPPAKMGPPGKSSPPKTSPKIPQAEDGNPGESNETLTSQSMDLNPLIAKAKEQTEHWEIQITLILDF